MLRSANALSRGRFDITSGVLRRCWRFDGSDRVPDPQTVSCAAAAHRLRKAPLAAPADHFARRAWRSTSAASARNTPWTGRWPWSPRRFAGAALVNFGGDLAANRAPGAGPWQVGVERPDTEREARLLLELSRGGARDQRGLRTAFCCARGCATATFSTARTGWPVRDAPRSVTVAASQLRRGRNARNARNAQGQWRRSVSRGAGGTLLVSAMSTDCRVSRALRYEGAPV